MRQRYHPFSLRHPPIPSTGSLGQSLDRPLPFLPDEENVPSVLKQSPHVGARSLLRPPPTAHWPRPFHSRDSRTAPPPRRGLRGITLAYEVGGCGTQGPSVVHTHIVEGPRCANDPHTHGLVKKRRRRLSDASLPRPLMCAKERLTPPSGHHNTAARIVSALNPRNQERIRPRHPLDTHDAARDIALAV